MKTYIRSGGYLWQERKANGYSVDVEDPFDASDASDAVVCHDATCIVFADEEDAEEWRESHPDAPPAVPVYWCGDVVYGLWSEEDREGCSDD